MWFVIMIIGVWFSAGIGEAFANHDTGAYLAALIFSVVAGVGYFIYLTGF